MAIQKQTANQVLTSLDRSSNMIEALVKAKRLDPKLGFKLVREIDGFADRFQIAAFGMAAFKRHQAHMARQAKVIQKDSDEKYMDTFDNPNKVIQSDADEPYMHKTPASFNAKAIDNYDQDRTTTVSERDEYTVRDLNEFADGTKKQPSWARGPAGKSTKQGSTAAPRRPVHPPKQWA